MSQAGEALDGRVAASKCNKWSEASKGSRLTRPLLETSPPIHNQDSRKQTKASTASIEHTTWTQRGYGSRRMVKPVMVMVMVVAALSSEKAMSGWREGG